MSKYFTNYEKEKAPLDGKGFEKGTDNQSKSYQSTKSIANRHKKRNWATVVYPESAPENWIELLTLSGVQSAISPLHDKDINPDEKTPKKPHWHVLMVYPGPKSLSSMKSFCATFGGVQPVALEAVRGYYRYLTHKDDPEKAQYREEDITTLNGFSILDWVELTRSEISKIKNELRLLIKQLDLVEYADFVDYVAENRTPEESEVACNNTYFFDKYLTSRRNQVRRKPTGEGAVLAREAED